MEDEVHRKHQVSMAAVVDLRSGDRTSTLPINARQGHRRVGSTWPAGLADLTAEQGVQLFRLPALSHGISHGLAEVQAERFVHLWRLSPQAKPVAFMDPRVAEVSSGAGILPTIEGRDRVGECFPILHHHVEGRPLPGVSRHARAASLVKVHLHVARHHDLPTPGVERQTRLHYHTAGACRLSGHDSQATYRAEAMQVAMMQPGFVPEVGLLSCVGLAQSIAAPRNNGFAQRTAAPDKVRCSQGP